MEREGMEQPVLVPVWSLGQLPSPHSLHAQESSFPRMVFV